MFGRDTDVTCPQCREPEACMQEFDSVAGDGWEYCTRCGYWKRTIAVKDRKKTAQIKAYTWKLLDEGKFEEALILTGYHTIEDLIQRCLNNREFVCFKLTNDGRQIYRGYKKEGYGAFWLFHKDAAGGQMGSLPHDNEERQKQIQELIGLRDKYEVTVTEILSDGTIIEY